MSILLHKCNFTFTGTVICIIFFWCNDPIPPELVEINCEFVTTAAAFTWTFEAAQTASLCSLFSLVTWEYFDEWALRRKNIKIFVFVLIMFVSLYTSISICQFLQLFTMISTDNLFLLTSFNCISTWLHCSKPSDQKQSHTTVDCNGNN